MEFDLKDKPGYHGMYKKDGTWYCSTCGKLTPMPNQDWQVVKR